AAHQGNIAFINGNILEDNTKVEGEVCIVVRPDGTADFTTTGAVTNADFFDVDYAAAGFELDDSFSFAITARTGGANQEVRIDNIVVTTGAGAKNFLDIENAEDGNLQFTFASKIGKFYDILSTTDPSQELALWDVFAGDIEATPDFNVEVFERPAEPELFFVVLEKEGPP
ncbi:MAG: hypothetical protein GWO24_30355, partial [Akkermansiaceae bacterium]|nr:hypothetical protein [Akkermansiaceae bacterium]